MLCYNQFNKKEAGFLYVTQFSTTYCSKFDRIGGDAVAKGTRVNPMTIRSKSALSQALLKLMMSKPFDEIAISDITDRAGLSRQTFYTNFNKKEDILNYLLNGLFDKYQARLMAEKTITSSFIVDYFLFWDDNKEFLALLFSQKLGYLFQEKNRAFFMDSIENMDELFMVEVWQLPYIKASLAGLTYELLWMWIVNDQGLSVNILTALASNILGGRIFDGT